MKRAAMVLNPISGGGRAKRAWRAFRKLVGTLPTVVSYEKSFLLDHYDVLCPYNYFIVFGGDGTLNEVVNAIYGCSIDSPYIVVVPTGSGNDFVKSLPYGQFVKFYPGIMRYGKSAVRYFVNVAGTGLDAYTAYYASEVKGKYLRGIPAYAYGLIKTMLSNSRVMHIRRSNIPLESELSILAFGRGAYVGGGFFLLPHARVEDQSIAWLSATYISALELLRNVHILFDGGILDFHKVSYGHTGEVYVEFAHPKVFQVDGEIIEGISALSVSVADTPVYVKYLRSPL